MKDKQFKNLDEQLEIFKYKGLIVNNEEYAKEVLLRENYFFLSGYRHLFMDPNNPKYYIEGATFEELYSLFLFDRQFRNIIFKNLLIVENNAKSIISYQLSKKYGYKENDYLKPNNFDMSPEKSRQVNDLIKKMKRQVRVNGSQHSATRHYISNYGYIPLWVLVKVLSFGMVCELYFILKPEDQVAIADIFGVDTNYLENFLPILSNYRNLCAHEDIVYEHRTEKSIYNTPYHEKMSIPRMDDEYIYGKNDIFAVLIIMKYLLRQDDFRIFMKEIEYEVEKLDGIIDSVPVEKILDQMGLPKNYMELVDL